MELVLGTTVNAVWISRSFESRSAMFSPLFPLIPVNGSTAILGRLILFCVWSSTTFVKLGVSAGLCAAGALLSAGFCV